MSALKAKIKGSKFWRFIYASGYWALVAMGSGIVSFVLLLIGVKESPKLFGVFILSVLVFCWGAYKAWSKTDDELKKERAKNGSPWVLWEIQSAYIDRVESESVLAMLFGRGRNHSLVMLELSIMNNSVVSTTIMPSLEISINTGFRTHQGQFIEKANGFYVDRMLISGHWQKIIHRPIDIEITSTNPLARGFPRQCWAVFAFDSLPAAKYDQALVTLTIRDGTWQDHTQKDPVDFVRGQIKPKSHNGFTIVDGD